MNIPPKSGAELTDAEVSAAVEYFKSLGLELDDYLRMLVRTDQDCKRARWDNGRW